MVGKHMRGARNVLYGLVTRAAVTFLCMAMSVAASAADGASEGALVIIGGALRTDNAAVWARVVALAGGKGAKIAVFPTAAANPDKSGRQTAEVLNRYGAQAFVVPIAPRLKDSDAVKAANDPSQHMCAPPPGCFSPAVSKHASRNHYAAQGVKTPSCLMPFGRSTAPVA
jgi:hypothetical protein